MASFQPHEPAVIDPIDALLSAHGLRRTAAARLVLGWLLAHPDTSYTHAQLQAALSGEGSSALDRVTLYRLIDRLTQVGLLLCRVDVKRMRRYQAMPASVHAMPHFECQSCHRDSPLTGALSGALQSDGHDLARAAQSALATLEALGYQGLSLDFAVRGVCVDCAIPVEELAPTLAASRAALPPEGVELRLGRPGASLLAPTLAQPVRPEPVEGGLPEGVVLPRGGRSAELAT